MIIKGHQRVVSQLPVVMWAQIEDARAASPGFRKVVTPLFSTPGGLRT